MKELTPEERNKFNKLMETLFTKFVLEKYPKEFFLDSINIETRLKDESDPIHKEFVDFVSKELGRLKKKAENKKLKDGKDEASFEF